MAEALAPVDYATHVPPPAFQCVAPSRFPFDETVERLKRAIEAEDLWLIHEIDPQMLLQRGGFRIQPIRQLLFFHPRYMRRLLERDPNAVIEAPLKLVIAQSPDGAVTVRYINIDTSFARYPALTDLAAELTTICQRLVQSVA
jgi:uncharacterized protein (DUF302 family)